MPIENYRTRLTPGQKEYLDRLIKAGRCKTISEAIRGIVQERQERDCGKEPFVSPLPIVPIRTKTEKKQEVAKPEPKKKKTTLKKPKTTKTIEDGPETPETVERSKIRYFEEKPKSDIDPDVLEQLRKEGKVPY